MLCSRIKRIESKNRHHPYQVIRHTNSHKIGASEQVRAGWIMFLVPTCSNRLNLRIEYDLHAVAYQYLLPAFLIHPLFATECMDFHRPKKAEGSVSLARVVERGGSQVVSGQLSPLQGCVSRSFVLILALRKHVLKVWYGSTIMQ